MTRRVHFAMRGGGKLFTMLSVLSGFRRRRARSRPMPGFGKDHPNCRCVMVPIVTPAMREVFHDALHAEANNNRREALRRLGFDFHGHPLPKPRPWWLQGAALTFLGMVAAAMAVTVASLTGHGLLALYCSVVVCDLALFRIIVRLWRKL